MRCRTPRCCVCFQLEMGQGASTFSAPLQRWFQMQQAKRPIPPPEPTADDIINKYLAVVKYAYNNPKNATIYLDDIQGRFFNKSCKFRWSWSEERPTTALSARLTTTEEAPNAGMATEYYRQVVEAISAKPERYENILNDIKIRYFDPSAVCNGRGITSAADYRKDLGPVFR